MSEQATATPVVDPNAWKATCFVEGHTAGIGARDPAKRVFSLFHRGKDGAIYTLANDGKAWVACDFDSRALATAALDKAPKPPGVA